MNHFFQSFDLWKFLAGLGLFLMGMTQIEGALKSLASRPFKLFLRDKTKNPLLGIGLGVVMTAILQSSGVVMLLLMAFAGAGVIELKNALGIILGSNIGTTLKGWIVSTLGFKIDFEQFIYPMIAIGSLIIVTVADTRKVYQLGRFICGFGLTFLGLGTMRFGVESVATLVNFNDYSGFHPILFVLVGFLLTTLIQSSSATMVITLSALNAKILGLEAAVAVIIGADLGSTMTAVFGAFRGIPVKKRVAAAHFSFNLLSDLVCFIMMSPILAFIHHGLKIEDPLYALVMFHTLLNIVAMVLFLPVLHPLARFLEIVIPNTNGFAAQFISKITAFVPEAALVGLERETKEYLQLVIHLNQENLGIGGNLHPTSSKSRFLNLGDDEPNHYEHLKRLEGEILTFIAKIQEQSLAPEISERLAQIIVAVRNGMMAAKGVKDIRHNIREFKASINDAVTSMNDTILLDAQKFYRQLIQLWDLQNKEVAFEQLADQMRAIRQLHQEHTRKIHDAASRHHLDEIDISSLLNLNSEIYEAHRALVLAMIDFLLDRAAGQHLQHASSWSS